MSSSAALVSRSGRVSHMTDFPAGWWIIWVKPSVLIPIQSNFSGVNNGESNNNEKAWWPPWPQQDIFNCFMCRSSTPDWGYVYLMFIPWVFEVLTTIYFKPWSLCMWCTSALIQIKFYWLWVWNLIIWIQCGHVWGILDLMSLQCMLLAKVFSW